ncbi:hypothetical protein H696_03363 [Fonticula alba]|uniref:Uncharacterized protein n=1 Tax=Fonticula alba TaxID=691883 RepID=A0A058Z708_FONAL|nr:hypothetical protein H696_03363 [Fonticula alba]KCV69896.1 hypothetical protein H696_03363 [Fonticula alba]|eukprot:XP_009495502.1 hypothetical protein H696_03363 [Fonticula alba]
MGVFRLTTLIEEHVPSRSWIISSPRNGLRVMPVDLGGFMFDLTHSRNLYAGQARGIAFDPCLIAPYLEAYCGWLAHHSIFPIFVADGLDPPEKSVTVHERFRSKTRSLNLALENYLQQLSLGQKDDSLAAFRKLSSGIALPNIRLNIQHQLGRLARQYPDRLAFVSCFTEADDLLTLLSLYFSAPVLGDDSDFIVHGFGRMKTSSLFRKQFILKRSGPDGRPVFMPGSGFHKPIRAEVILSSSLASLCETTSTKLAWLPLIMGADFGPPDGRLWRVFLENADMDPKRWGSLRAFFQGAQPGYVLQDTPWPMSGGTNFKSNWSMYVKNANLSREDLCAIFQALPEPADLAQFVQVPEELDLGIPFSLALPMLQHQDLLPGLLEHLQTSCGAGTLMLKERHLRPRFPHMGVKQIHDGILLNLGIFDASLGAQAGSRRLGEFALELQNYLTNSRFVRPRNKWCIFSPRPPPSFSPPAGGPPPQRFRSPRAAPRCQCRHALYLAQAHLQENLLSSQVHSAFCSTHAEAPAPLRPMAVDSFLASRGRAAHQVTFHLPRMPQFGLREGVSVWNPVRQARFLAYALLARGPAGRHQASDLLRVVEYEPLPFQLGGHFPAAPACVMRTYETACLDVMPLLQRVDQLLGADREGHALDRLLLLMILLADRHSGSPPGPEEIGQDLQLLRELTAVLAREDHPAIEEYLRSLGLPRDVSSVAGRALAPAGDLRFSQYILEYCARRATAAFIGLPPGTDVGVQVACPSGVEVALAAQVERLTVSDEEPIPPEQPRARHASPVPAASAGATPPTRAPAQSVAEEASEDSPMAKSGRRRRASSKQALLPAHSALSLSGQSPAEPRAPRPKLRAQTEADRASQGQAPACPAPEEAHPAKDPPKKGSADGAQGKRTRGRKAPERPSPPKQTSDQGSPVRDAPVRDARVRDARVQDARVQDAPAQELPAPQRPRTKHTVLFSPEKLNAMAMTQSLASSWLSVYATLAGRRLSLHLQQAAGGPGREMCRIPSPSFVVECIFLMMNTEYP